MLVLAGAGLLACADAVDRSAVAPHARATTSTAGPATPSIPPSEPNAAVLPSMATARPGAAPASRPAGGRDRHDRPGWLGTRPLPLRPDGFGTVLPTPPALTDRRLATVDLLAPPPGDGFVATIGPVPPDVAARSTWAPACPVALADLRYATVTFVGFDGEHHTGELLLHADVAEDVVAVFERLFALRFPIEEMRVVRADELTAAPTGDGNNTSAFACRPAVGTAAWSEHAYGRAVDLNPFHNPYVRGDLVVPELAGAYTDRGDARPGMVLPGDAVTEAFAAAGWRWGGDFSSSFDPMHFSATGR